MAPLRHLTHTDPADPNQETNIAHAISFSASYPNVTHTFHLQPFALGALPPETHLTPYTLHVNDTYFMFYCAGGWDRTQSMIILATSPNLYSWTRHRPLFAGGVDGREMVLDRGVDGRDAVRDALLLIY